MADKFANWAALAAGEVEGTDYLLTTSLNATETSHIAIHAGGVEPGSGEVAKSVSAALGQQLYCMEGIKSSGNGDLHITSTNFDEPTCVALQHDVRQTISYHGAAGTDLTTHLGGADMVLMNKVGSALMAAGFTVDFHTTEDINGSAGANIVNKNLAGMGVQLEMSSGLRDSFFPGGNTAAIRNDPTKRTAAFTSYVAAIVSALQQNTVNVWDGTQWLEVAPQVSLNGSWTPVSPPLYWDNHEWMSAPPTPTEFPVYEGGMASKFTATDGVSCAIPAAVRTNDFIVSVMAQQDGEDRSPRLLSPAGVIPTLYTLTSGVRLYVAVWPWEPSKGTLVVWDVTGSDNTACMNMVYRFGDIANMSLTPVVSMTGFTNTMSVPLPSSGDFTNVYVVLTVANTLTGTAWPSGVVPRNSILGTFGTKSISLVSADTPGAGGSPGNLALDTTADTAVVALIQIPGKTDGKPTWVLNSSVLGSTTVLG